MLGALLLLAPACVRPPRVEPPQVAPQARRSVILAADGTPLATLFEENRDPVDFAEIPQALQQAVVAAEDQRFFHHDGVDGKAIARAAIANVAAGEAVQGGSTITQQLVKNTYFPVDRAKTFQQKIVEAQLAWKIEQGLSKQEILTRYLNTVYFGDGAYGVKAAAEVFFSKHLGNLTLAESALLAGLIKAPGTYNPRRNPDLALARRNHVLVRMKALGYVDEVAFAEAGAAPVALARRSNGTIREPHFVEYVKQAVLADPAFGETEADRANLLFRGGVTIRTSLDLKLQQGARRAIDSVLGAPGDPAAALVAIEPGTGKVVAMIGGRDFSSSQVNLALGRRGGGSGRQAGSAFKPLVLAAAVEDLIYPHTVYPGSSPVIRVSDTEVWIPRNFGGARYGAMTLENATVRSVNTVYARLGMDVGPSRVAATARRMGITAPLDTHPSIALGAEEVSPLDMAAAYATLANFGVHLSPTPILEISRDGESLFPTSTEQRAMAPGHAWMVTDVLQEVIRRGTGTRAQIGRPAAGKSGTSQDFADAWFVGYTPELVAAVWVGYPRGRVPMLNVRGSRGIGAIFPALIWRSFMLSALEGTPTSPFQLPPTDLIEVDIDPATGLLAGPWCSGSKTVKMLRQLAPTATCPSPPPRPSPPPSPSPSPSSSPEPSPQATPSGDPEPSASPTTTPNPPD